MVLHRCHNDGSLVIKTREGERNTRKLWMACVKTYVLTRELDVVLVTPDDGLNYSMGNTTRPQLQ